MLRSFPFDDETENHYRSDWWKTRMGIGHLAQCVRLWKDSQIAMLAFYGDGSGEHGKGRMVLAGYLGDTVDLLYLELEWNAALQSDPPIKYFKASQCVPEANKLLGEFAGWTRSDAEAKRLKLASVIHRHSSRLAPISSTIMWDEYHSVIGDGLVKSIFYHPYFFCLNGALSFAIECSNHTFKRFDGTIFPILDQEFDKIESDIREQYALSVDNLPQSVTSRVRDPYWTSDMKMPLLQTADFLAWSIRAKYSGFTSPVLGLLWDQERVAGGGERNVNTAALAQFVVEQETNTEVATQ